MLYLVAYICRVIPDDHYMKWAQALDYICSHASNKYTFLAGLYNVMRVLTLATRIESNGGKW